MIIRQWQPVNLEFPFDRLDALLTPNEWFYVRSHFTAPRLDQNSYRLRLDGAVERALEWSYADLRSLPSITRSATLECAGNSRIFLDSQPDGARWQLGAVGTADWTGVPLKLLLERAGLHDSAREVIFEGADRGIPKEKPAPAGDIAYARSLACEKALAAEVLVAYQMNGHDLSADHGYPVRLIVPGFYGMASVKWLTHIHATSAPFEGYWQTTDYAYWEEENGLAVRRPLGKLQIKSQIARPAPYEAIGAGQSYTIAGAAWGGDSEIVEVSVSTDSGQSWRAAELLDQSPLFVWKRWQIAWHVPRETGRTTLLSRARCADGTVQPAQHNKNHGSYMVHHTLPIEVSIV